MSKLAIRNVADTTNHVRDSVGIPTPKIKLGDAIHAIGQSLQGIELHLTRDKTSTDAAIFE